MFGSLFFLGYTGTGILLYFMGAMPRRKLVIVAATVEVLAQAGLVLIDNLYSRYFFMFLIGLFIFGYN